MRGRLMPMLALVLAASCADDNSSIFIRGIPIPEVEENGCTWDGAATTFLLAPGTYNVEADQILGEQPAYRLVVAATNQLQPRATSGRPETNGVHITRVEVEIKAAGETLNLGDGVPNPYSVSAASYIPPASDPMSPGVGIISFAAIPGNYAQPLRSAMDAGTQEVVLEVRFFGKTMGEIDIETGVWSWPVQLCTGECLFAFVGPSDEAALACFPGQDTVSFIRR